MNIRNRFRVFCLVVSSILVLSINAQSFSVTLRGTVIDRPQSSQLMLIKYGEDARSTEWISIPIVDGKFEYVLNCDHEELYQLIFYDEWRRAAWKPVEFISEQGVINFTLHPFNLSHENIVEGGALNKAFQDFIIEGSDREKRLEEKIETQIGKLSEDAPDFSSAMEAVVDSLVQEFALWVLQYVRERPTIAGYSILLFAKDFLFERLDISQIVDVYQTVFAPKFPNHPHTARMKILFAGLSVKAGVPFVDFTAVDFTGKQVRLSERIAGKPTVLHLWASWCAPCRKTGMELIPVYEEFRDKGFVVIGVARERNISAAVAAIELDKYPWENLVELNDAEQIWAKYGIGNSGGSVFLIDEKGNIVAVEPSVEKIRDFLLNNL